jgi:hypothetical protein
MGALHSLFIAATGPTNESSLIQFDRYVAINTPVQLLHGVSKLDEFYRAPLEWPATNRTDNIENTFLKVADLSKSTLTPQTSLPFSAIESKFLIGLTFRLKLQDIIYSSQQRNNQGILQQPIRKMRREPMYQELLQYSYQDYFEKFAVPYYWSAGVDSTAEALEMRSAGWQLVVLPTFSIAHRTPPSSTSLDVLRTRLYCPPSSAFSGSFGPA